MWVWAEQRDLFAHDLILGRSGEPWVVRDYQLASMNSEASRKVHCDGRDVGKTSEIILTVLWASVMKPNNEMLIATPCKNHLYPLMKRVVDGILSVPALARNVVEIQRGNSGCVRFQNGFILWGRVAGRGGAWAYAAGVCVV